MIKCEPEKFPIRPSSRLGKIRTEGQINQEGLSWKAERVVKREKERAELVFEIGLTLLSHRLI